MGDPEFDPVDAYLRELGPEAEQRRRGTEALRNRCAAEQMRRAGRSE